MRTWKSCTWLWVVALALLLLLFGPRTLKAAPITTLDDPGELTAFPAGWSVLKDLPLFGDLRQRDLQGSGRRPPAIPVRGTPRGC